MFGKIRVFLEMIKIEHTLFALPFAFMGMLLGSVVINGHLPSWAQAGWILLAMIGARSAAMGMNRLIDRYIDAKNPRTEKRAIPAGLLKTSEVAIFVVVFLGLFLWATWELSRFALTLFPIALALILLYSYTKRFTWLCHIVLGATIALAPLGGWAAVTDSFSWSSLVFYVAIAFWTAGFDVIYACDDIDFDRKEGIYSIPSRFGLEKALKIAQGFHVVTAIGLISLVFITPLGWWYAAGVVIACSILFYQHRIVKPSDLSRVQTAFFTMNSWLSSIVFVFTLIDLVVKFW
ncbi:UbiA-like polyprenyltransferase [Saccharibacillus endophyticus]|uniref:4-hydroxybenzoate octaprenyltransferase n=1 Tax=Saccharibacillus endophyticus TaxID=2060666 RepID=A0ABQ1ZN61_9BACL|nr:UbiA-like polyprenyltransferase [Saccharibacillus endophyticus]GGH72224.1 4-hydroxybenzoate octaprenyltransferase [Saccharibacillus endophyticus]